MSLERPDENDFRLRIDVAAVSSRKRMSTPSIRTFTMGSRSQRSIGISEIACGSLARAPKQNGNRQKNRSKQRFRFLGLAISCVELHIGSSTSHRCHEYVYLIAKRVSRTCGGGFRRTLANRPSPLCD